MEKKRLLITASTFPRWENDTEPRFILDYAKAMKMYYDVTVLVPMAPGSKEYEVLEGVEVIRFHYFPIHMLETLCYPGAIVPRIREKKARVLLVPFLFLMQKIKLCQISKNFDVVHAHWLIPQGIMQTKIKDVPYLVTGHGGDVTSLNIFPLKGMKKRCLHNAIAVVGVSEYICKKMKTIDPDIELHMISMGCDIEKFSPQKRNENYFEGKSIVFVGRLAEKKGVRYLIDAMEMVDAKLYIVGKGPLEASLKNMVKEKKLESRVSFLGPKSHDELPEILASSDLFVAPSIVAKDGDQEGLPVSIMEAMASGLPVVSGISGGTSDIVKDGVNGFILDARDTKRLADRINCILNDDMLRMQMKEEALKSAEKYSYESIGRQYYEVIQNAIKDWNAV